MSCQLLGHHFDIHGGGADLQFPHHENEIAQSEGAFPDENGKSFVNTWMHNGFVRVNEEKMSKSLGNFFTIREVLKVFDPEVVRFFILKAHYRSPLNYSDAHLEEAKQGLTRLYNALSSVENIPSYSKQSEWRTRFVKVMGDDFNTPEAIAILFELANEINKAEGDTQRDLARELKQLAKLLGLLERSPQDFLQGSGGRDAEATDAVAIEEAIQARILAKQAKDFAKADQIRQELLAQGIVLEDKPDGVTLWRRA
jgi:cysteinyl-tRNA synthetase